MGQKVRRCRVCGCTDDDCHQCVEKTGKPCHWMEDDLCSACAEEMSDEDGGFIYDDEYDEDEDYEDPDFDDDEDLDFSSDYDDEEYPYDDED
jgi:hypothetical protein